MARRQVKLVLTLDRLACVLLLLLPVRIQIHLPVVRLSVGTNCIKYDLVKCVLFPSLRLAALSIWLSHIQSVLVLQSHRNLRFPPSQFQNRAKTSEALIGSCFLTVQVCFLGAFRKWRHNQRTIALSLEHKFVMADAKNLYFQAQYFHLEGAKVHFNDRNRYSHFWEAEKKAFL